jgi:uncharacterized protein
MSRVTWLITAFSLALGILYSDLQAEVDIPALSSPVVDQTGTLSAADITTLSSAIERLAAERGSQIAILLVPTTAPETIEQFGIRVAERWRIGRRGIDDGVIVLVATADRAVRLEVGYGLEGALPDAIAKRIIEDIIVPRFRRGDVGDGLAAGVEAIAAIIRGESLPQAEARPEASPSDFIFVIIILGTFLSALLAPLLGQVGGATVSAIGSALIGLALAAPFIAIVAGLMVFFFSLSGGGRAGRFGGYHVGGGGRPMPRNYSGGGGGFGGGGASGRW